MKKKLFLTFAFSAILVAFVSLTSYAQFEIGQASSAPTIDATIDAVWDAQPKYVAVDPTTWTPSPDHTSLEDCSFTWSSMWDADNLYFLVEVKDDIATTGKVGGANYNWMNDNVEITINDPAGANGSWMWRFAYDRDDEYLMDEGQAPTGASFATASVTGGYIVEVQIPWSVMVSDTIDFSAYPAVDLVMNMGVYVADLDDPEAEGWDKLSGHVQWPKGWSATDVTLKASATVDDVAPGAVTSLAAADVTYNSAALSWSIPTDTDIQGYLLLANDAPKVFIANADTTSWILSNLVSETAYTISIITVDAQNLSTSVTVEFTTGTTPVPQSLDIGKYSGSYSDPFEDQDYWDGLWAFDLGYLKGDAINDDSDLDGSMKIVWNDDALFMQVNVVDEDIVNGDEAQPWTNDAVEYHFDMGGERDGSSTEDAFDNYDPNNFQYRAIPYTVWQTGSTPAADWTGMSLATYDYYGDGTAVIGYSLELNFPFAALNTSSGLTFSPAIDATISFDPKIVDKDADGSASTLSWSSFSHGDQYKNDAEFGLLILKLTGIETVALQNRIKVYPNPATDNLNIKIDESFTGTINITDLSGKVVSSEVVENFSGNKTISLSSIAKGLYIISLENRSNDVFRTKFIVD